MRKEELAVLSIEALKKEIFELKKTLFNLRLSASTMQVKDYSQFKKIRVSIAQALTYLGQKQNNIK